MRPKSIATVVSVFRERVSSVMPFSVDSTVISLIVRISVVLPAANGPVTTILTAVPVVRRRFLVVMSQPPHAGDQPKEQALVHTRVPFDEWRGRSCGRCATRGGSNCRRDRLRVVRLTLGKERLGALRGDLFALSGLRGHHWRARRADRSHVGDLLVHCRLGSRRGGLGRRGGRRLGRLGDGGLLEPCQ